MRTTSWLWAKRAKDLDRSQDELPKDLISRSGRIRKVKDVSRNYFVGKDKDDKLLASMEKSDKVTTATPTTTKWENSEKVETESGKMEAGVAPMTATEEIPKRETVKDNKSRVNADLLQKVLSESVEEWFSFTEMVKSNKGKPYKKRKILLPPLDESDFCFELTETKDTVKNPEDGNKRIDSTSDKEPETHLSEESKKEDVALETNKNEKVGNTLIKKECQTRMESYSFRKVDEVVKKERDKRFQRENTKMIKGTSKTDEISENEIEKTTKNGKNKSFRHFFALILYGDEMDGETEFDMTAGSKQVISSQQAKTVIKTLDLETADLKEFEVELGDFCKLPKDSPIFECVTGIERLLQTGTTGSSLRKSLSAECLNVLPKSDNESPKRSAEMPATLPSRQKKMNLKARECFLVLRKDIIEKYKRKAEYKMKQEVEELRGKRNEEVKAEDKKREQTEKAKEFTKEDSKEMDVDKTELKKKPKTNESDHEKMDKWKVNGAIEDKVETELEKGRMKVVPNVTFTKTKKLMMEKRMESVKDKKMSGMRFKKRKRHVRTRDKLFSYVNKIKRKSGYISSSESAESQNVSYEEPTSKAFECNRETRVNDEKETEPKQDLEVEEKSEETKERRKSQREIKLTPKLVHMIATSHKRARRSPSIREDSVEDTDYEYPNLLKKVVSGTVTPEVVESPPSASAIENYLQSKIEANASNFECSWEPGDLVWARFAGSPFWPSLILRDPFSNDEYTKVKHLGRLLKTFVHLQFLADSGRRAWVPELYCMSFNGLDEFEKIKSNLPKIDSFTKRNDIVYQKAFFPTKKMEKAWFDAVKEGETLLTKSKDERITYMKTKYPLVKYAASVTNGVSLVCNGSTSDESKKPQLRARRRNTRSSSWMELSDWPNSEKAATAEETCTKANESFECVRPTASQDNKMGDEKEAPKITLKLVRSPKKEEKRRWSKSLEGIKDQLTKRPKMEVQDNDVHVSTGRVSNSEVSSGSQKGGRMEKEEEEEEEVCQVCLRMMENANVIKCKGVCSGLFPKCCRKTMGVELPSFEEGAAPALKKRKRRRKFSSPHVNRWKQKLWTIFDFYKEFGGCKREGMDMRGLLKLYRSLCNNKSGNRRRPAKLRKIK